MIQAIKDKNEILYKSNNLLLTKMGTIETE